MEKIRSWVRGEGERELGKARGMESVNEDGVGEAGQGGKKKKEIRSLKEV